MIIDVIILRIENPRKGAENRRITEAPLFQIKSKEPPRGDGNCHFPCPPFVLIENRDTPEGDGNGDVFYICNPVLVLRIEILRKETENSNKT